MLVYIKLPLSRKSRGCSKVMCTRNSRCAMRMRTANFRYTSRKSPQTLRRLKNKLTAYSLLTGPKGTKINI